MKRKKISEVIDNINAEFISEASEYEFSAENKKTMRMTWRISAAAAACLAIILAICIPVVINKFTAPEHDCTSDSVMMIEFENAYYEIIEYPRVAEKHGLNKEITESSIGEHIAYLQEKDPDALRSDYKVVDCTTADCETNFELLEYSPMPCKAVKVFKIGDSYLYALLFDYLIRPDECLPTRDAFEAFGVFNADDIASIATAEGDNLWQPKGDVITDRNLISEFYSEIIALPVLSSDTHDSCHELAFADYNISRPYVHEENDRSDIIIETKDGLRFAIYYYRSCGMINVPVTKSYCQLTSETLNLIFGSIK